MFSLSKWYCDCVSDEGVAFIGYRARMRWGLLTIPYAATLYKPADGVTRERYSTRGCVTPSVEENELRWDCSRLGVRAAWSPRAPAIHRVLFDSTEGSIEWRCHFPHAQARVDLAEPGRLSGLGYAEQLHLTMKPWRLPFEELRWGRLLTPDDAVIWIEWRGREPRQWVFHNGSELRGATIDQTGVELPNDLGVVELTDPVVLREGRLTSTALGVIPWASGWLPRGIKNAHETKWLARGMLTTGTRSSSGWAIHEVVRWR